MNSPKVWIVATPIGNPGDLSLRAKSILESVDFVLAEDTRRAGILCQQCSIEVKQFISFHEHNECSKLNVILEMLNNGKKLALISDAGMPSISDPGYTLIHACKQKSIPIAVVPGPSALLTALVGSGIAPHPFTFFGFLPRSRKEQEKILSPYATITSTLLFFENKNRIVNTLRVAYDILGSREVCIARELTKTYEEYLFFNLEDSHKAQDLLGELTIVIGPPKIEYITEQSEVLYLIEKEKKLGGTSREIAKRVQTHTIGWPIKKIYTIIVTKG